MKTIQIIATGGTIAGISKNPSSGSYKSGNVEIDELLVHIPELKNIANIKTEQLVNIGSQDLDERILLKLAKRVQKAVDDENIDGVLILHGSDTLEESAYFLHITVKTKKPIVYTASMRSGSALSSDGEMNIYNALSVAVKAPKKMGVMVVLNDEIHCAREVTKTNTTSLNAFTSPNSGKIGFVNFGEVSFYTRSLRKHTYKSQLSIMDIKKLPRVDIVYSHFEDMGTFIRASVDVGAKAIVYAGFGNGNIFHEALKALHEASKKGIIIARSSRVGSGIVSQKAEIDDEKYGFITTDNLNPQKARVLLMICLAFGLDKKSIAKAFYSY